MAIEKTYLLGKNITLGCGFDLQAKAPLDSRQTVPEYAGLQALIDGNAAYEGMIVYDEETKKTYQAQLVDGVLAFREFGINEAELKDLIASETTAAMEFKGVAAALPEAGAKGDMYKVSAAFDVAEDDDAQAEGFSAKVGDIIVCNGEGKWFLIPSGDDIEDTWRPVTDVNNDAALTFAAGDKIDVAVAANGTVTYSHEAIDAPVDVTAEGDEKTRTYITAVETDGFGHITGYKTATENVEDTNTTYAFEGQSEEATSVYFQVTSSEEGATAEVVYLDAYSKNEADAELAKKLDKSVYEAYIAGKAMSDEELKQYADDQVEEAKVFMVELDGETGKASATFDEIAAVLYDGREVGVEVDGAVLRISYIDSETDVMHFSGVVAIGNSYGLASATVDADGTYKLKLTELADKEYVDDSKTIIIAIDAEAMETQTVSMTASEIIEAMQSGHDVILCTIAGVYRVCGTTWAGDTVFFRNIYMYDDAGNATPELAEIRIDNNGKWTSRSIKLAEEADIEAIEDRVEVLEAYKTSNDEALAGVKATAEAADDKAAQAQNEVDALENYVGTFVHDTAKSVVEYINAKTDGIATSGNLETLAGRVTAVEGAVATKAEQSVLEAAVEALEGADSAQVKRIEAIEAKFGDGEGNVESQIAAAVGAEKSRAEGAEAGLQAAINAINNADTGILKQAKNYADGKDGAIANAQKAGDDAMAEAQKKVASVAAADASVTVGGTSTAPTVAAKLSADADNALTLAEDGLKVVIPAAAEYSIVKAADSGDYAAVYNLTKDGTIVGASINIPKDLVVKSGKVENGNIVLVLNDEANTEITIPATSLIEYVTSGSAAGDMVVVNVSDDHKVTASITDGAITLAKLHVDVQTAIGKAHSHENADVLSGISADDIVAWDAAEQNAKDYADEQFAKAKTVVVSVTENNGDMTGTASMTSAEIAAAVQNGNDVSFIIGDYGLRLTKIVSNIAYFGTNVNFTNVTNDFLAGEFIYFEVAVDADGKYTVDMVSIATSKDVNEKIGEVSEGKTVVEMISDAQDAAEGHADGLNSAMNARVEALEAIDHEHSNADVLNGISAEKVAAWDTAEGKVDTGDQNVSEYVAAAIEGAKADAANKDAVVLAEAQKGIAAVEAEVAKKANDADLAAVAKSGLIDDLSIGEGTVLIFDCGGAE